MEVGGRCRYRPVTIGPQADLVDAARLMRECHAGVRRAPVVDDGDRVVGVLSIDDVPDHIALQLGAMAGSLRHEQAIERIARP